MTNENIVRRINQFAENTLPENTPVHQTVNGYWIAWLPEIAAVLPPDLPDDADCDWVEGLDSLAELVVLIESGEYEEIIANEDHLHHEHGCGCGYSHLQAA